MSDWVADGRFVDAIIGFTLLETLGLLVYHRLSGRGPASGSILPTLASGLCLMLALRATIAGAAWPWIVAAIFASGLAHASDLRRRWNTGASRR